MQRKKECATSFNPKALMGSNAEVRGRASSSCRLYIPRKQSGTKALNSCKWVGKPKSVVGRPKSKLRGEVFVLKLGCWELERVEAGVLGAEGGLFFFAVGKEHLMGHLLDGSLCIRSLNNCVSLLSIPCRTWLFSFCVGVLPHAKEALERARERSTWISVLPSHKASIYTLCLAPHLKCIFTLSGS